MFTNIFLTLLIATVASAVRLDTARQVSPLVLARRQCRRQKPLICNLIPVSGSSISGKILFTSTFRNVKGKPHCFVRIRGTVTGLKGGKRQAFHIHTYGDTSALDGTSTGPHFANPDGTSAMHGLPNDADRHWGDFGNLVNEGGAAKYNRIDKVITLAGILGRGVTIHEGRDMGSAQQPSGNAGSRMAVCVIGFANPSSL